MNIDYNTDVIEEMLSPLNRHDYLDSINTVEWNRGSTLAILIHLSIYEEFQQVAKSVYHVDILNDSYDYKLDVDGMVFDMKLIYVHNNNKDFEWFIHYCLDFGTVSLFSVKNPNLFVVEERYHLLKKFIRMEQLESSIVKVEARPGLMFGPKYSSPITVITFIERNHINWFKIVIKFHEFLLDNNLELNQNYYQVIAFPWLQLSNLNDYPNMVSHDTLFVLFLVCDFELDDNVFDLCNLKLAFCSDPRIVNSSIANFLDEIDSFIVRSLNRLKYTTNLFENGLFDVDQYLTERNSFASYRTIRYFQYTFQEYFDGIKYKDDSHDFKHRNSVYPKHKTIKLVDHPDLRIVTQMVDVSFDIDCTNYFKIDLAHLFSIHNIRGIILDTNQRWVDSDQSNRLLEIPDDTLDEKRIVCKGDNSHSFIENFLSTLNELKLWPCLKFEIEAPLQNYTIFNKTLFSEIIFHEIRVDLAMLEQLQSCNIIPTELRFYDCYLQNETNVWDLLCKMENIGVSIIKEEETTWHCLFEFVAEKLNETYFQEFTFPLRVSIKSSLNEVLLDNFTFLMDQSNSKIIMVSDDSKMEIDLYYLKNEILDDQSDDYEFYN